MHTHGLSSLSASLYRHRYPPPLSFGGRHGSLEGLCDLSEDVRGRLILKTKTGRGKKLTAIRMRMKGKSPGIVVHYIHATTLNTQEEAPSLHITLCFQYVMLQVGSPDV